MGSIHYIGTSGFSYAHWRGRFYPPELPQREWLGYYARHFATVELNNPFYRLPAENTLAGWRERVPETFRFAVKASRYITHVQRLRNAGDALATFLARMRLLGEKLGAVLYQVPPGMHRDVEALDKFLSLLPADVRHVIEFRHASWYDDAALAVLKRHGVTLCIHDMQGSASPVAATASLAYVRLHGTTGRYQGGYSDPQLRTWARRIRGLEAEEVYIFFNNDIDGHAVDNARTLGRMLSGSRRRRSRRASD